MLKDVIGGSGRGGEYFFCCGNDALPSSVDCMLANVFCHITGGTIALNDPNFELPRVRARRSDIHVHRSYLWKQRTFTIMLLEESA
jgi:hypothetical protein